MNQSWGTALKNWDEVGLSDPKDNEEANSLQPKNYPRWFDRQAFKSYNYVKYCQKYVRAFEAIDPGAKTGFEGSGSIANGDNVDLFIRDVTFWAPYPGTADEISRSIAPRNASWKLDGLCERPRQSAVAVFAHGRPQRRRVVVDVGEHWSVSRLARPRSAAAARGQASHRGHADCARRAGRPVAAHIAAQDAGIVFLHSYPSVFACRLPEEGGFGGYELAHTQLFGAIRDLGLQFRYVADRMLRQDECDLTKCKVLVLARAAAISDKEAQLIGNFAEQGGTVIADIRPGLYTEHCKPRRRGVLNDLFGIACDGKAARRPESSSQPKRPRFACNSPVRMSTQALRSQARRPSTWPPWTACRP